MTEHNTTQEQNRTALKDRIIGMLAESTGINALDSGGANGRMWQRNQLIKEWDDTPVVSLDVYEGGVIPSYSIYHYLMNFLSITPESEKLDADLQDFMSASNNSFNHNYDPNMII